MERRDLQEVLGFNARMNQEKVKKTLKGGLKDENANPYHFYSHFFGICDKHFSDNGCRLSDQTCHFDQPDAPWWNS